MNLIYPLMGFFHPADGIVEITAMDRDRCVGCGQTISMLYPRPSKWIDRITGEIIGSHDHQHVCGIWNPPCSILIKIDMQQPIDQQLEDGATEVKKLVAESINKQNNDWGDNNEDEEEHIRCQAITRQGKRCTRVTENPYCHQHSKKKIGLRLSEETARAGTDYVGGRAK